MATLADRYARAVADLNAGRAREAYEGALAVLARAPHEGGVHHIAGLAALACGRPDLAVGHFEQAVRADAARPERHAQLARALAACRRFDAALRSADAAWAATPRDAATLDAIGGVYVRLGRHDVAALAFRAGCAAAPDAAGLRFNLATCLTFLGDFAGAEAAYRDTIVRDPAFWRAYYGLAQLGRAARDADAAQGWTRLLAAAGPGDGQARLYLNLALARVHEDAGDIDRAFAHLRAAKDDEHRARAGSEREDDAMFDALEADMPPPASTGHADGRALFIVGMPRSGTTLVEQILSAHRDVRSCGELQEFGVELKRASGSRTPRMLDRDTVVRSRALDWRALGAAYIDATRHLAGDAARFTDKLPHNVLHAAHIANAMPAARIVLVERDPRDTGLGNFRQLFALTSPLYDYAFDLGRIGRYLRRVERWTQALDRAHPGRIVRVRYESLVARPDAEIPALLARCGLAFDDACLRPERNPGAVATASTVQVREAIHDRSIGRWRQWAHHLGPLLAELDAPATTRRE